MRDPAVESARRAWEAGGYPFGVGGQGLAESAAREMAKPVRELFERWCATNPPTGSDLWRILDELAELIFSTEELER